MHELSLGVHPLPADYEVETDHAILPVTGDSAPALRVSPFRYREALAGKPFIHRYDLTRHDAAFRVSRTFIEIGANTEHPAFAAWTGEWLVYEQTEEGTREMQRDLLMVEEGR